MFRAERIADALWPETLGIATYGVGMLTAASIDSAMQQAGTYEYPWVQTGVTWGSLLGGAAALGYGHAPGFSKGLIYGSGVGMLVTMIRGLWEMARREEARGRLSDFAALVPRRVGAVRRVAGNTGLRLETRPGLVVHPGTREPVATGAQIVS